MADNQVVLGLFADEAAADAAVESLKAWDKASDDVKLGAIGVLVVDDTGALKTHKMGQRSTKKGAGIGLVLAIVAPPTLLAGVVGGGVLGAFHHKGLGLTDEDSDAHRRGADRWQGRRRRPRADRRGRASRRQAHRARWRRGSPRRLGRGLQAVAEAAPDAEVPAPVA